MSNLIWLTEVQMARLQPFFPKSHGMPRVEDASGYETPYGCTNGLRPIAPIYHILLIQYIIH